MKEDYLLNEAIGDFKQLLWYIEEDIEPEIKDKIKKWKLMKKTLVREKPK